MALLRKVRSSTLFEAIVATLLIVIIFMVASLILNNLLLNNQQGNTRIAINRFNELKYSLQNGNILLPYNENYEDWTIQIKLEQQSEYNFIVFMAENKLTSKSISRKAIYDKP
jgi:hypothetical protein